MPKRAIYLTPKPLFLSSQNQSLRLATLNPLSLINLSLVFYNSDINLTIEFYNREGILINTVNVTQSITLKLKNSDYSMITWNDSNNYNVYGYIQEILPQSLEEYEQLLSDFDLDIIPFSLQNPRGSVIFTASQNWQVPSGVHKIKIIAIAGGGGGGGGSASYAGGGGGAGAISYVEAMANPGDTLNIQVGAGGSAGIGGSSPTAGGIGGKTQVLDPNGNVIVAALGGGGGAPGGASAAGAGGAGGENGGIGWSPTTNKVLFALSYAGMNGVSGSGTTPGGFAFTPTLFPPGFAISSNTLQASYNLPAAGYGGGGGNTNSNGVAGGGGVVIIWWGD